MSASLILAWAFHPTAVQPDFEAGKAVNLTPEETKDFWDQTAGEYDADDPEFDADSTRDRIADYLDRLAEGADLTIACPGGHTLFACGGSSWGDDPTPGFTAMSNLLAVPRVLRACGFEVR